jgi:hypothetical protein
VAAVAGVGIVDYGPKLMAAPILAAVVAIIAFSRIEVLYGVLYAVAFLGPAYAGNGIWPPFLGLAVAFIAARELLLGRRPILAGFLFLYCGVYVVAAVHGDWNPASVPALRSLLTPALFAMATASIAREPAVRRRLVVMMAPLILLQLPVAVLQSVQGIGSKGAGQYSRFGDAVTGTLGGSASGTLALVTVGYGTILFAASLARVWRPRVLMIGAVVLAGAGVVSVARAVFIFVPVAFGAVLVASGFLAHRSVGLRRIVGLTTVVLLLTPAAIFAMSALYPGVTSDINSVQKVSDYLFLPNNGPNPERAAQLSLAVHEVGASGGVETVLLGKGVGTTWLSSDPHLVTSANDPLVLKSEQFTNSVWSPHLLVEAGVLGFVAFLALLFWALNLASRARNRVADHSWDAAIVLAIPGLVALTFVGSFYQTVLDLPPFATLLWTMLGLCLAIARGPAGGTADAEA